MRKSDRPLYSIGGGGEQRMGSAAYTIELARAVKGVKLFRTVNGQVLEAPGGSCLAIFDSCVLLIVDFGQSAVHHFQADKGSFLRDIQLQPGGGLSLRQESPQGSRPLKLNWQTKQGLRAGFGPVSGGCFPSAMAAQGS